MAVLNGAAHVADAVTSILGQGVPDLEVVVVDDGSTDNTVEVLSQFGDHLRVDSRPHRGHAAALNRGIEQARGDVFAFLDADDIWPAGSLGCRLARLDAPDQPEIVFGRTRQFVSPDTSQAVRRRLRFDPWPVSVAFLGAAVVRRSAMDAVGDLDESLTTGANIDWMGRARQLGCAQVPLDDVVLLRRLHDRNMGRQAATASRNGDLLRIVRNQRRRRAEAPAADA
jgi:glycosyltransferase involved in cell wall biosynthesis